MVDNGVVELKCEDDDDLINISSGDLMQINTAEAAEFIHLLEQDQHTIVIPEYQMPVIIGKQDHFNKVPDLDEVNTAFNFNVELHSKNCGKNSLYSAKLNKVYIKMLQTFTVDINYVPKNVDLFLRAMIVYSLNEEKHNPVVRCNNHRLERNEKHPNAVSHILRCGRLDTQYYGTDDGQIFSDKLSILVPLGNGGYGDAVNDTIALEFVCQNSCVSGINRRSTAIIFTLEGLNAEIYGKKVMNFKVCSCPGRDMTKEESVATNQSFPRKRKSGESRYPDGKRPCKVTMPAVPKVKSEIVTPPPYVNAASPSFTPANDVGARSINIVMPDSETAYYMLRSGYNEITGKMASSKNPDAYINYARAIKKLMDKEEAHMKSSNPNIN